MFNICYVYRWSGSVCPIVSIVLSIYIYIYYVYSESLAKTTPFQTNTNAHQSIVYPTYINFFSIYLYISLNGT